MEKDKLALTFAAFLTGIGGAIASNLLTPVAGYSKFSLNPALNRQGQTVSCVVRKTCSDDPSHPICTINLPRQSDNAIIPFTLYRLSVSAEGEAQCLTVLYEPQP